MSTDYEYRENGCGHCGRHDVRQVAHKGGGWSTMFKVYDNPLIRSREDWVAYLREVPGRLYGDNGQGHIADAVAWAQEQWAPPIRQQRKEDDWLGTYAERGPIFRDPEGFRISSGETS